MSKEIFVRLEHELGRSPTDEEMSDAMANLIDSALEAHGQACLGCIIPRDDCGACRTAKWNFKYTAGPKEDECPCEDAGKINCAACQDLPVWRMS